MALMEEKLSAMAAGGESLDNPASTAAGSSSVKAAIHKFQSNSSSSPALSHLDFLQNLPSKARQLRLVRKSISDLSDNTRAAQSKAEAEVHLHRAKKTVKELASRIEESSTRAKKDKIELHKINGMVRSEAESVPKHQYEQARTELELLKASLSKLRLEIELAREETSRALEEAESSKSKTGSYLNTIESLRKEIEEANEEQVLVELATIEALKEFAMIEDQKSSESGRFAFTLEEMRGKMNAMVDEINQGKKIGEELVAAEYDMEMLRDQLVSLKEMGQSIANRGSAEQSGSNLQELFLQWKSITEETEEAKKRLELTQQEGFEVMASMDVIRQEKMKIVDEIAKTNKSIEKWDKCVKNLNSKLVRARIKLEAAMAGEEKAKGMFSSLSATLKELKKEKEAAEEERKNLLEEAENVKAETERRENERESNQEKLQAALGELDVISSSEMEALEKLKILTEKAMRERADAAEGKSAESSITISRFEYEYLCGCAAAAQEAAAKKVEAAKEWVVALMAGEREARVRAEMVEKEKEELEGKESLGGMEVGRRSSVEVEEGKITPCRKTKMRRSSSPSIKHMSPRTTSFTVKRRRKVMPVIAKYFANMNIDKG